MLEKSCLPVEGGEGVSFFRSVVSDSTALRFVFTGNKKRRWEMVCKVEMLVYTSKPLVGWWESEKKINQQNK